MTSARDEKDNEADSPRSPASDTFVAYGVGPQAWGAGGLERSVARTAAAAIGLHGLAAMSLITALVTIWNPLHRTVQVRIELLALACVSLAVLGRSLLGIIFQWEDNLPTLVSLALRVISFAVFLSTWVALTPLSAALLLFPIGLFAGADIGLTAHLVGFNRTTMRSSIWFFVSPIHLGALAAIGATVLYSPNARATTVALSVLVAAEISVCVCLISSAQVHRLFQQECAVADEIRDEQRSMEHHRRAHWIHDDVCADIRELRVKVVERTFSAVEVERELEELDYRLRLRQLDEVIAGGRATAAEVLQPYLRKLQHQGIALTSVPHFDESAIQVYGHTAELLQRCAAGLTANAVSAGATAVGFSLRSSEEFLVLTVTDDAGGFKLEEAPAGRGLSRLAYDLKPGGLSVIPSGHGSAVISRIPLESPHR